jgi:hypothetical protein
MISSASKLSRRDNSARTGLITGREARLNAGLRARRLATALMCAGSVWSLAQPVAAFSIEAVDVPEGCGSERELRAGLAELSADPAQLEQRVRLAIEADSAEFEMQLEIGDEQRQLRDRSCRTLFRSAQVMLAAALGVAHPEVPELAAPAFERNPWQVTAAIGGGAVLGVVPDLGARFDALLGLERGWLGAQLGGHYIAPSIERLDTGDVGARVSVYGVRAAAVFVPVSRLRAALGAELSYAHATGIARFGRAGGAWTAGAVLEVSGRVLKLGPAYLDLALWGQWAWVRPQFEIAGVGAVYRLPEWAGGALARVGWTIL